MSVFAGRFDSAFQRMVDQLGQPTTMTLRDGTTLARNGIFTPQTYAIDHTDDATFYYRDDATVGLTKEQADRCTEITIDGRVWEVIDAKQDKDGAHQLMVKAPQIVT